jgi:hypothetical protein
MLAEGGMRVSELVRVNIQDITDKGLFIRASKREKNRFVALSPRTIDMLRDFIINVRQKTDEKALITGDYGRMSTAMIRKDVKQMGKMAPAVIGLRGGQHLIADFGAIHKKFIIAQTANIGTGGFKRFVNLKCGAAIGCRRGVKRIGDFMRRRTNPLRTPV